MNQRPNWNFLENYIPIKQFVSLWQCTEEEKVSVFVEPLANIERQIKTMPALYATENLNADQIRIGVHYYAGSTDVWVYELDRKTLEATAFVCLNGDRYNAESGPIWLPDIVRAIFIELDLYWDGNRTLAEVMESRCP